MKLVEILARELEVWPDTDAITQWKRCLQITDDNGKIIGGLSELADDYLECYVTRPQWQAERDRMKAMESIELKDTEGLREALKDWEAAGKPMGDWVTITEPTVSYEQELWDRVAVAATQAFITGHITHFGHENVWQDKELVSCAADYADAFMAERAKRVGK